MMILVLVVSLISGMCISEYYNRRIQVIMRDSWRETENAKRRANWVYTPQDLERMRNGERVIKRRDTM